MIEPTFRKKLFVFAFIIDVCLTSWIVGLFFFGWKIQSYIQDKTTPTDAIVVLTGGRNRIHEAIELLNTGLASKLFISGVPKNIQVGDIEKVAGIKVNVKERVELGRQATNTIENAQEVADWCRQNGIKSIRLVTSNYHIPRSSAELNSHHLDLKVIKYPVYSEKVASAWWSSWGTFKLIAMEYNKFLIVSLRNLCKGAWL